MKNRKHILKISSIFLTAAMLLSSMGAAAFAAEKTPAGTIDKLATNGSSFLSSSDKAGALEAVRDGVLNYQSNIDIKDYRIKADDAGLLLDAVKSCYPETFCLAQTVYVSPTQIGGVSYISSVIPQYQTSSAEEYNTMLSAFYAKADEYLSLVDDSMNDFTKAVVLHDAIVMNSEYYITKDGVSATPYTLMVEGWGKCEDYSRVYAYLLAQTGIKSELVDSDSMNHEWIKIQLEGKYYEVDVTWDDPVSSKDKLDSPGRVSHDYFLFSNSSFPNHSGYYELRAYTRWMLNFNVREHYYRTDETWWFYNKKMAADYFRVWDGLYSRVLPIYSKPDTKGDYDSRRMYQRPKTRLPRQKKGDLVVTFYPEGGHLIEGVENRVAFDITDQHGEAVNIKGTVTAEGQQPFDIQTEYMGRGSFTVTPTNKRMKATFTWRDKEWDIRLPKSEEQGAAFRLEGKRLTILASNLPQDKDYAVSILCRGSLKHFEQVSLNSPSTTIELPLEKLPSGVADVTLFDSDGQILADRLLFVNNHEHDKESQLRPRIDPAQNA